MYKKHKFYVNIGDWSDDGHRESDRFLFESNYPVAQLQEAYKASCKKTGLELHTVCERYGEFTIEAKAFDTLIKHGCPMVYIKDCAEEYYDEMEANPRPKGFAQIIMWFVGLSMPEDFTCESKTDEIPNFNGFWGDLNESFGYGLYGG